MIGSIPIMQFKNPLKIVADSTSFRIGEWSTEIVTDGNEIRIYVAHESLEIPFEFGGPMNLEATEWGACLMVLNDDN